MHGKSDLKDRGPDKGGKPGNFGVAITVTSTNSQTLVSLLILQAELKARGLFWPYPQSIQQGGIAPQHLHTRSFLGDCLIGF